jgi:hypothetical protein
MGTRITKATIASAVKDSAAGKAYDRSDMETKGLILRVGPRGVRWSLRVTLLDKPTRWDLGLATLHDPDIYRAIAREARELCRQGIDPTDHIKRRTGVAIDPVMPLAEPASTWTFDQAVAAFLEEKSKTRAIATVDDYSWKLKDEKEWRKLRDRPISEIDDSDVQRVLNKIGDRGAYTSAEGIHRVVRALFNWCAKPGQKKASGVAKGQIADVQPPDRPRLTAGRAQEIEDSATSLPTPEELGRIAAIVDMQVFPPPLNIAVDLLLRTAQRRSTVVAIAQSNMELIRQAEVPNVPVDGEWIAWVAPPYFMKGRKAVHHSPSTMPHLVPIPERLLGRLEKCKRASTVVSDYYFAPTRVRRAGQAPKYPHMHPSTLSHALLNLPGILCSLHDVRRAFFTYGKDFLGFVDGEPEIILDHAEGRADTVGGRHYDRRTHLARKVEMMKAWNEWIDKLAVEAIRADPLLRDRDKLRAEIERLGGPKVKPEPKNPKKPKVAKATSKEIGASLRDLGRAAAARGFHPDMSDPDRPKPFQGIIDMMKADLDKMDAEDDKRKAVERSERVAARRGRKRRI